MTFYEAALRVLEAAGRPLHFAEITEKSIQQNLLSHVGKTPELTMLSRLLAMARRKTDRKIVVTSKDTFALADWALPEEPDALAETAKSEIREEDNLPPLRPAERHPEPRPENVRIAGRGSERKRRRDEEEGKRRKKKYPPVPEVVFEILTDEGGPLRPSEIAERARERELASKDLTDEQILTALLEDNQRRIDAGRRPQFVYDKERGEVNLERAGAPSEAPPIELQAAFAAALGIPMEEGRPVLPKAPAQAQAAEEVAQAQAALKTAAKDARRAVARALRRRLAELEPGTFEKAMVKVLHALGFRELKVAKRSKEGPLLTARKREGSLELRYAIRLLKGSATVDRRAVQELRKDLGHYSAQVALLACAGDLRGEARSEAVGHGALVFLWCGDALAEKFLESGAGVQVTNIAAYEIDDRFFEVAKLEAEEAQRRREERKSERAQREEQAEAGERAATSEDAEKEPASEPEEGVSAAAEEGGGEAGDEDLDEAEAFVGGARAEEGEEGAAPTGERRRRRRRRRGRRGRGKSAEGQAAPEGEGAAAPEGGPEGGEAASAAGSPKAGGGDASPPSAETWSAEPEQVTRPAAPAPEPEAPRAEPAASGDAPLAASPSAPATPPPPPGTGEGSA